jgi:hypothetical protein
MSNKGGWIGVDLDGTLAKYDGWKGPEHIGEPVPAMVARVKAWLKARREVRIFTARCFPFTQVIPADFETAALIERLPADPLMDPRKLEAAKAIAAIQQWCREQFGVALPVTCVKDYGMTQLWDDRAVQVWPNEGRPFSCPADDPLGYEMGG